MVNEEVEIELKKRMTKAIIIVIVTFLIAAIPAFIHLEKKRREVKRLNEERVLVLKAALSEFPVAQVFNKAFPKASFQLKVDGFNYIFISPKVGSNYYFCSLPIHKIVDGVVSFRGKPELYYTTEILTEHSWSFSEKKEITEEEMKKLFEKGS